ncbi:MAG: hypothetical protein WKG07_21805 [Hymenobacter sp.]
MPYPTPPDLNPDATPTPRRPSTQESPQQPAPARHLGRAGGGAAHRLHLRRAGLVRAIFRRRAGRDAEGILSDNAGQWAIGQRFGGVLWPGYCFFKRDCYPLDISQRLGY